MAPSHTFHHIQVTEPTPPVTMQERVYAPYPPAPSSTNFSILAIAIIGIVATAFLLVSYYVFVIKCCLNWHHFGHRLRAFRNLRDFRSDPQNHHRPMVYAPENQGLEEHIIQSIPIFRFKRKDCFLCEDAYECSVCLNEFEEGQKLRILPKCGHAFHIDCIDTWLQAHSNCPLCRACISSQVLAHQYMIDLEEAHRETCQSFHSGAENDHSRENVHSSQRLEESLGLTDSGGESATVEGGSRAIPKKAVESGFLEVKFMGRKSAGQGKKLGQHQHHLSSAGDECILVRESDQQFCVEPIRRSFSMDFDADRHLYISLTDILAQNPHLREVSNSTGEGCSSSSSSRGRRTFFPFGHGRGIPRNAILPIKVEAGIS
ncbi:RING-H2 finger protein [Nymphaea thermarum]|nr:RING-H2 finger protein [Nymphaea thermarum]